MGIALPGLAALRTKERFDDTRQLTMNSAHRNKGRNKGRAQSAAFCPAEEKDMSAGARNKKKTGYTTVLLRLTTGARPKSRRLAQSHQSSRVKFIRERATPEHLIASLRAFQTAACSS